MSIKLQSPLDIPCVYSITNLVNRKRYIGSTVSFKDRKYRHICELKRNDHCNPHLQSSWNKYGEGAFAFGIISVVENCDYLMDTENAWLVGFKPEYNIVLFDDSCNRRKFSPEAIHKMSISAIKRVKEIGAPNTGKKFSISHRAKLSQARLNAPPEVGRKISAAMTGKQSPRKGIKTGKPAWNRGIPRTDEQKRDQSIAMKASHRKRKKLL